MSDFPKAVARVSEGFCPLCDEELTESVHQQTTSHDYGIMDVENPPPTPWNPTYPTPQLRTDCLRCLVSWVLGDVDGRPILMPNRPLNDDEIRFLYDRGDH